MRFEAWLETAKFRTLQTAGSPILLKEGQFVGVIIIEKWDDIDTALDALRKLMRTEEA